jgi:hypothetical protein
MIVERSQLAVAVATEDIFGEESRLNAYQAGSAQPER